MHSHKENAQLDAEWRRRADAAPAVHCMLAVFALHDVQRREEAARLLGLLSEGLPFLGTMVAKVRRLCSRSIPRRSPSRIGRLRNSASPPGLSKSWTRIILQPPASCPSLASSRKLWRVRVQRLRWCMTISFARHQLPPAIIRHAVWLYVRFTLSYRDVEDLLAERGLDISYETVRRWVLKFGPLFARELRRRRPRPTTRWHLDEMAVMIAGRRFWLWRAVDDEGEVLDLLVQRRRDKAAAVKLMRKLLKKQGFANEVLVTDKLRSYGAAKSEIGLSARHDQGLRANNRAEN